jgi:hypothetical protein
VPEHASSDTSAILKKPTNSFFPFPVSRTHRMSQIAAQAEAYATETQCSANGTIAPSPLPITRHIPATYLGILSPRVAVYRTRSSLFLSGPTPM